MGRLDSGLEDIVPALINTIHKMILTFPGQRDDFYLVLQPCFRILYSLCKCRGYKTILSLFPHAVSDLEVIVGKY